MTFLKKEIMYMQLKFQHPVDIILSNGSTLSLSLSLSIHKHMQKLEVVAHALSVHPQQHYNASKCEK